MMCKGPALLPFYSLLSGYEEQLTSAPQLMGSLEWGPHGELCSFLVFLKGSPGL